jgi:hypothetical protein
VLQSSSSVTRTHGVHDACIPTCKNVCGPVTFLAMLGHQCSILRSRGLCWWQSNPQRFLLGTHIGGHSVHTNGKAADYSDTSMVVHGPEVADKVEGHGKPGIASSTTGTACDKRSKEPAAVKEKQKGTKTIKRWRMVVWSCHCATAKDLQSTRVCNTA